VPVKTLIDPPVLMTREEPLSRIISTLIQTNSYDIFIELLGKIAAVNIRDIIGIKDIKTTRPSLIGKIIPALQLDSVIAEAARIMSHYRMRTVPVIDDNKIVGQISAKRIVELISRNLAENKLGILASDVMTGSPIVIGSNKTISSAKSIMKRRRIDHLPVIDNGNLVGIITSSDIMQLMLPTERIGKKSIGIDNTEDRLNLEISGVVNKDVITADVSESLQSVCDHMISTGSTYCIIKVWDEVQGIITYRDVVALLGEKIEEDIPMFIIGLPDDPLDAELAKSKFANIIKFLRRIYPDIEQAHCRIKLRKITGARKRYEIDVHVLSTHGGITYTKNGWDLATLFDEMTNALKKKISHKSPKYKKIL
jgi:CBS domain-containing protein